MFCYVLGYDGFFYFFCVILGIIFWCYWLGECGCWLMKKLFLRSWKFFLFLCVLVIWCVWWWNWVLVMLVCIVLFICWKVFCVVCCLSMRDVIWFCWKVFMCLRSVCRSWFRRYLIWCVWFVRWLVFLLSVLSLVCFICWWWRLCCNWLWVLSCDVVCWILIWFLVLMLICFISWRIWSWMLFWCCLMIVLVILIVSICCCFLMIFFLLCWWICFMLGLLRLILVFCVICFLLCLFRVLLFIRMVFGCFSRLVLNCRLLCRWMIYLFFLVWLVWGLVMCCCLNVSRWFMRIVCGWFCCNCVIVCSSILVWCFLRLRSVIWICWYCLWSVGCIVCVWSRRWWDSGWKFSLLIFF